MPEPKVDVVIQAIREVVGERPEPVALHEPLFNGREWDYVKECLDTGWVSSAGTFVDRFEDMLARYTGARHAIATVNGTAALHLCLKLADVQAGDEVIIPTLTFIATANAVQYCGATPYFADSEERTLGLDPAKLAAELSTHAEIRDGRCINKRSRAAIKAVVPMHAFGHPVDLGPLIEVCRRWHISLIEDAAESLGSSYEGRHTGTFGMAGALSFNGNKIITTGGGGAILTDDPTLAKAAKHLSTTARIPHRWSFIHDDVGYNYRMPNINSALGCAQLEQLPEFLARKRNLAERYARVFKGIPWARVVLERDNVRSNYWLNVLLLDKAHAHLRDALLEATNAMGIMTRPVWTLMHRLPMFSRCPRMDLSTAEDLERRLVNLPSSAALAL